MMDKTVITLILVVLAAFGLYLSVPDAQLSPFEEWKKTYSPHGWTASEENYRKMIFQQNLETINKHNADPYQTYKKGVNQFTIYTNEQFVQIFLNPIVIQTPVADVSMEVTADVDWVAKGMVSPIKNQGQCGSCWAFSAIASVQSYFRTKGTHVSLSEQQLVDCSGSYGNHGCNGGSHVEGLKYVKDHGVETESQYPYVGKTQTCKKQGGANKITNVEQARGCTGFQNALMSRPIGVGVDAQGWGAYKSGIFSNCGTALNHAVQLVGVSSTYWKIKNSWGAGWGESGYIRLALGNTCGLCSSEGAWAI